MGKSHTLIFKCHPLSVRSSTLLVLIKWFSAFASGRHFWWNNKILLLRHQRHKRKAINFIIALLHMLNYTFKVEFSPCSLKTKNVIILSLNASGQSWRMLQHFPFSLLENWHLWKWKAQMDISNHGNHKYLWVESSEGIKRDYTPPLLFFCALPVVIVGKSHEAAEHSAYQVFF